MNEIVNTKLLLTVFLLDSVLFVQSKTKSNLFFKFKIEPTFFI